MVKSIYKKRVIIPVGGMICAFFVLFFLINPLIDKKTVPAVNKSVKTPNPDHELLYASSRGDTLKCAYFLGQGADIDARDKAGRTALMRASRRGHNDTVILLLQSGCAVDLQDTLGYDALMIAAEYGRADVVRTLLRFGSNINTGREQYRTPLLLAAQKGHNAVLNVLIEHGASLYEGQSAARGPLAAALHNKHAESALLLLQAGSPVNELDDKGNSVLGMAVIANAEEVVKYILNNKTFNPFHRNHAGKTVIELSEQLNNPVIIELLKKYK